MKKNRLMIAVMVVLPLLIGVGSAILTKQMSLEYEGLKLPALSPPAIVFPIAWTILYILMGIAAGIIYTSEDSCYRFLGLMFHYMQLVFNFFWSLIFFNMKNYTFALIWIVLLWLVVLSMIVNFKQVSKTAAILNIPYLVWLTFAGYLNLMICILN